LIYQYLSAIVGDSMGYAEWSDQLQHILIKCSQKPGKLATSILEEENGAPEILVFCNALKDSKRCILWRVLQDKMCLYVS
jgi:hypothetical protein